MDDRAARLLELQSGVRTSTEGSRVINAEIASILRVHPYGPHHLTNKPEFEWRAINGLVHLIGSEGSCGNFMPPDYTSSIDAALALVERVLPGVQGFGVDKHCLQDQPSAYATLQGVDDSGLIKFKIAGGKAATPPLAILDALLSALIAETSEPKVVEHG